VATLADSTLRATPEQLCDALAACVDLLPVYRRLLKMELEQPDRLEQQMDKLEREIAQLLQEHSAAVERLAAVPRLGWSRGNISSPKSAPRQPFSPPPNSSPRG